MSTIYFHYKRICESETNEEVMQQWKEEENTGVRWEVLSENYVNSHCEKFYLHILCIKEQMQTKHLC